MKGNIRALSLLLGITGLVGSIATYKAASIISAHARKTVSVYHLDDRLSIEQRKAIITFLQFSHNNSMHEYLIALKKQFPAVDVAQVAYLPGAVEYTVSAHDLCACINNRYGITCKGVALESQLYTKEYRETLSSFIVCDEQSIQHAAPLPSKLFSWLSIVSSKVFQTFQVTWCNEHEVHIKNKKDGGISLWCTAEQLCDEQVVPKYAQIITDLTERFSMAKLTSHIADVRFDKQIILSKR